MPRYDYRCTGCGHEFELIQRFREAGSGTCPVCSGAGRRVFHAVPVIYKGSGFYTTDYGRPKPPRENSGKETSGKADSSDGASNAGASGDGASGSPEAKSDSPAKAAS